MKVLKFLLILILLTLPLGELFRFEIWNNIVFKPLDVFVGLAAFFAVLMRISNRVKFPTTHLTKPITVFSAIALLSLAVNSSSLTIDQIFTALLYWVRFVSYVAIYYIVLAIDKHTLKKIQVLLLVAGVIFVLLGFIQVFLYSNLRNLYYLGWDEHNYRLFSTFLDPNFAGAFLVLFLLFLFSKIEHNFRIKNANNAIKLGLLSILNVTALFLTYSRSAILMLIAGLGLYLILINKKRFLFILFGVLGLGIMILSPTFNKENTNLLRKTSSFARLETYDNALQIIYDHPFFGVGFNAYRYAQESYGFRPVDSKFPDHAEAGADNSLLFVTATTGIIGIAAYLYMWYSILKKSYTYNRKGDKTYPSLIIASVLGLFINSFFINSLFFPPIMLWMWVIVGLMDRK